LEEMVAWGCRNDLPARFISATLHVDESLKMDGQTWRLPKIRVGYPVHGSRLRKTTFQ